jgi:signal transduction histidine kinase
MTVALAELQAIDLFEGVPEEQLRPWLDALEEKRLAPGDEVQHFGSRTGAFTLLLEGRLDGYLRRDGHDEHDHYHQAPTWLGAMSTLTGDESIVTIRASEPSRIAQVGAEGFKALLFATPVAFQRVMRTFRPVLSRFSAMESQREKLAALGQMSAGLAHELNNPAAAAKRSAQALGDALDSINTVMATFIDAGVEREEAAELVRLQQDALVRACAATPQDAIGLADAEDQMGELLEVHGIPDAWRIAEPLAAAGLDRDWLDQVQRNAGPAFPAAVDWVATSLTARSLADDLREATGRMSELVGAIKAYTYMDKSDLQEVDVHDGLEATLTILHHKLKHTRIKVRREYGEGVPRICVYGSELNQVWTNLLDNAIDALGEEGTITVATACWRGTGVEVAISDDGPGIPEDVQRRVFDPFFTTKGVGAGTGLGLDATRRIVHDRHDGDLAFASRPGQTTFTVRLPRAPRKS